MFKHKRLYQELAHSAEIISALLEGISEEEARIKPTPESRSMLEVICHIHDEEIEDFRPRLDVILHRPDEEFTPIDPEGWVASRAYNERNLEETLAAFLAERQKSLTWLNGLNTPNWEAMYHAPFGAVRAGDMLAAWVAHDILHIRQLVELRWNQVISFAEPYNVRYAGEW